MVRGTDVNGSAANFVETEQIVELEDGTPNSRRWTSFLQVINIFNSSSFSKKNFYRQQVKNFGVT